MNAIDKKLELAQRLKLLTEDFRFRWGESANRFEGNVGISVDRVSDDEQLQCLVTVSAGFPPPEEVRGLPWTLRNAESGAIERAGSTDGRGQFWLKDLPEAEYRLTIDGLVAMVEIDEVFATAIGSTQELRQVFHAAGLQAQLRVGAAGHFLLEMEVDLSHWKNAQLALFRISDKQDILLGQGYMGIYEIGGGKGFAAIDLDALDPSIRVSSAECHLVIQPVDTVDRDILQRSLEATTDTRSSAILEAALNRLGN